METKRKITTVAGLAAYIEEKVVEPMTGLEADFHEMKTNIRIIKQDVGHVKTDVSGWKQAIIRLERHFASDPDSQMDVLAEVEKLKTRLHDIEKKIGLRQ